MQELRFAHKGLESIEFADKPIRDWVREVNLTGTTELKSLYIDPDYPDEPARRFKMDIPKMESKTYHRQYKTITFELDVDAQITDVHIKSPVMPICVQVRVDGDMIASAIVSDDSGIVKVFDEPFMVRAKDIEYTILHVVLLFDESADIDHNDVSASVDVLDQPFEVPESGLVQIKPTGANCGYYIKYERGEIYPTWLLDDWVQTTYNDEPIDQIVWDDVQ